MQIRPYRFWHRWTKDPFLGKVLAEPLVWFIVLQLILVGLWLPYTIWYYLIR